MKTKRDESRYSYVGKYKVIKKLKLSNRRALSVGTILYQNMIMIDYMA